jgi:hypothetical protein
VPDTPKSEACPQKKITSLWTTTVPVMTRVPDCVLHCRLAFPAENEQDHVAKSNPPPLWHPKCAELVLDEKGHDVVTLQYARRSPRDLRTSYKSLLSGEIRYDAQKALHRPVPLRRLLGLTRQSGAKMLHC